MLDAIPGLERVEPAEQEICCGSAGIYNIVQPETAAEPGDQHPPQHLADQETREPDGIDGQLPTIEHAKARFSHVLVFRTAGVPPAHDS